LGNRSLKKRQKFNNIIGKKKNSSSIQSSSGGLDMEVNDRKRETPSMVLKEGRRKEIKSERWGKEALRSGRLSAWLS